MEPAAQPSEIQRHLAELVPAEAGVVTATLAGMMIAGPEGGLIAGTAAAVVQHVVREEMARRFQRAADVVEIAATEAQMTPEELLERIRADDRLLELAASVIAAAAETALKTKVRLLGRALARGTLAADDATIDHERFMVDTLAALEAPHLRVLQQINQRYSGYGRRTTPDGQRQAHGWTFEALASRQPGLRPVIRPILSVLTAQALIFDTAVGTWGYSSGKSERWIITEYGRRFLDLLEERGSEEPDPPTQDPPKV
jgi:hypothetical protein